jgi:protein phosphatase
MDSATTLCIDGLTDLGVRRLNNEDAWWIGQVGGSSCFMEPGSAPLSLPIESLQQPAFLIVSDGVGGANAGEVASQMAVTLISAGLAQSAGALVQSSSAQDAILAVLGSANETIKTKAAEPGFEGMGATLSLLGLASGGSAYWGQVGDSRIYLYRAGVLRQISRDHSPVGRLRQQGKITEEEARRHPQRNQIDQSLGDPMNPFEPDTGVEEAQPGDVFLLCSDGLSDGLWDREIGQILAAVHQAADVRPAVQQLVGRAKTASGRDNITAVVAFLAGPQPAAVPPAGKDASLIGRLRKIVKRE